MSKERGTKKVPKVKIMMTSKQEWFLMKLIKQLEEKDAEKYDIKWKMMNIYFFMNGLSIYSTTKKEASEDIQLCLNELGAN